MTRRKRLKRRRLPLHVTPDFCIWLWHLYQALPSHITPLGECWRYKKSFVGIPTAEYKRHSYKVPRLVLAAHTNTLENIKSPRLVAMHLCDNGWCVNPEHLSWGTQKQNVADCVSKGRWRGGAKVYP